MKNRLLQALGATALLCSTWSLSAVAGDGHHRKNVFNDYARVVHVEPKYRVVTRHVPQRTCDSPRRHHQQRRHSHNNRGNQRHDAGAVFISGVIGGAIGHELTRSANGRSNPGAVIAGAAIGAGLAASHQHHNKPGNRVYEAPHRQHSVHQKHRRPHCTTTTHVQRTRQPDGYLVTYRYHGHTYQTHTDYHPGDRIPVRVAITTRN